MSLPTPDNIDYARTSNVARMHAAVAREKSEPIAKATPITLGVIAGIAGLAIIAGGYLGSNTGPISKWGDANIKGYGYKTDFGDVGHAAKGLTPEQLHEPENWIAQGRTVFSNCASCHQTTGVGIAGQYPPLKGSEFVIKGEKRLAAVLWHGLVGSVNVNGQTFNGVMDPWGSAKLTPTQTAQVLSYIRNDWGNKGSVIYEDQVVALGKELGPPAALNEEKLRAIPEDANAPPSKWPELLKKAAGGAAAPGTPAPAPGAAAPAPTPAPTPAPK
jgi:mono/diheme cytochrome c family protein